ncbi:uncharacterized protein LOC130625553 [Hydractinia symbiolongicarpus]|uniref:uncharacterized protein LOC130625553 n=1 Tax=Hydractinia symbiolongicarpus TaxID=13093 RepID=UPI00254F408F|nr:uncharacterized protein LOC130625553 [Hydractinia symbiolongicarpus]
MASSFTLANLSDIVGKSKSQIDKFTKPDLVQFLIKVQDEVKEKVGLKEIKDSVDEIKNNVLKRILDDNKNMKKRIRLLEKENDEIYESQINLEMKINAQDQYSRRNNLEIIGISDDIADRNLEAKVISILQEIGVTCDCNEIEACHRLPKSKRERDSKFPKRTIVRFVNRKKAEKALENRKKLKDSVNHRKVVISDNLCPAYKALLGMSSQLYHEGRIASSWSWKGNVFIKPNITDEPFKIFHVSDLDYYYDDVSLE